MAPIARRGRASLGLAALLTCSLPMHASGQAEPDDTLVYSLDPVVVTATRGPRELSRIPQPVSVVQLRDLQRRSANTVADLFRSLPGLDVTGVGVNQGRPQIRGLKGQRILLLADGLRLNNSRRQQDFGELPALVDVTAVERVEVVRGPASVLYGSDAIGGVVNVITRVPREGGIHGYGSVKYGDVENQRSASVRVQGRFNAFTVQAGGTVRDADAYRAPSGSYGDITLADEVLVNGTGTTDRNADLRLGYEAGEHSLFVKFELYDADDSGFGSVDPSLYNPGAPEIDITYPMQTFNKVSAGYRASNVSSALVDQVELLAYGQDNERQLRFGIGPFPIGPTATLEQRNLNTTDIRSYGMRAEARKLAVPEVLLTYGVDVWRDGVEGTDENTTITTGFGPTPIETVSDRPQLPKSTYVSIGTFLQSEVEATDRLSLVAGARWQYVNARTRVTTGLFEPPVDVTDGTVVWALNSVFRATDELSLVGTVGRAFRSPNLIERFFDGPVPEGSGYQVRNPELDPETSLNVDLGARFRRGRVGVEAFAFRNRIRDGIRVQPLGYDVSGLPGFQMINVDELLFRGIELGADVDIGSGFSANGTFTWMDTEDVNDTDNPVGESFSNKLTGALRYDDPGGRFWATGEVRRNGDQKEADLGTSNPVGTFMPAFTVVDLHAGVAVWRSDSGMEHRLNVALTNLTDELYAEFANVGFFRPEPKRNVTLSWHVTF